MYEDFLKKNKLQLNKKYDCDFILKSIFQNEQRVNFFYIYERDGISPCLIFECYGKEFIGSFGIMNSELIQDKYDKAAIINTFCFLEDGKDYNTECFSKIKKFISIKENI